MCFFLCSYAHAAQCLSCQQHRVYRVYRQYWVCRYPVSVSHSFCWDNNKCLLLRGQHNMRAAIRDRTRDLKIFSLTLSQLSYYSSRCTENNMYVTHYTHSAPHTTHNMRHFQNIENVSWSTVLCVTGSLVQVNEPSQVGYDTRWKKLYLLNL
jgi:hypothetical protein